MKRRRNSDTKTGNIEPPLNYRISLFGGVVPFRPSYRVYISQLIRFARVCSHVEDLNARNEGFTGKLLKQVFGIISLKRLYFQVLSLTPRVCFKIQCQIKISYTKDYRDQNFMVT